MPRLTREFTIDRPVDDTWEFFVTPEKVAPCLPGCRDVEEVREDVFDAKVDVSVAYTDLTFDTHAEVVDKRPPNAAVVEVSAEPAGRMPGSASATGDLALDADGNGTSGTIDIEFAIRGRLGSLGESAFRHKCDELTDRFLENVASELEGPADDGE